MNGLYSSRESFVEMKNNQQLSELRLVLREKSTETGNKKNKCCVLSWRKRTEISL